MSWFFLLLLLSLVASGFSAGSHDQKQSAVVVGTVYCDTCFHDEFSKTSHFISDASVAVECKDGDSRPSFRQEVKTNEHGEFKVHLPFSVSKHVKRIQGCSVKLIRSSETYCGVASTATSSSIHLKSRKHGNHIFSAGFFTFKPLKQPILCNEKPSNQKPKQLTKKKPSGQNILNPELLSPEDPVLATPIVPPNQLFPPPIIPPNPFQPPPLLPPNPLQPPPLLPPNPFQPPPAPLIPNPFQPPPAPLIPNPFQPPPAPLIPNPFQPPPAPIIPNPFQPPPAPIIPNPFQPPPAPLIPNPFQPPPAPRFPPNPFQPPPAPPSPLFPFPPIPGLTPPSPPPPPPDFPFPLPPFPFPPIPPFPGIPPASTSPKESSP